MKKACWLMGVLFAGAMVVSASDLVISSFTNGILSWTYPTNDICEYRIEWASDTTLGDWTDLEHGLQSIAPTSNVMSACVPMYYRVKGLQTPSKDMVYIPSGRFHMGDHFNDGPHVDRPVRTAYISAFYIDRYEVTKGLWDDVYNWAITNGYQFGYTGGGKAADHPVHTVNWYDCVKWCNARSEKEGLTPAYYTSTSQTPETIYRVGQITIENSWVQWDSGYRLPTDAEWEKAARGGTAGRRFPWSDTDTIQHKQANYFSRINEAYDISPTRGYHPAYSTNGMPYTSPVGSFGPNGYGLYDMAGNVWEWCWDWRSDSYYANLPMMNPHGPDSGEFRIFRGGAWFDRSTSSICASIFNGNPAVPSPAQNVGFRCARGL